MALNKTGFPKASMAGSRDGRLGASGSADGMRCRKDPFPTPGRGGGGAPFATRDSAPQLTAPSWAACDCRSESWAWWRQAGEGRLSRPRPGCCWSPCTPTAGVSGSSQARECLPGAMETGEPWLNKRPRGWLAARGRGGGRRRRGGQRVGGAEGSCGRRLQGGGGRPGPQAPPRLGVSRLQADGWGFFRRWWQQRRRRRRQRL
jgi:hypothetical protein